MFEFITYLQFLTFITGISIAVFVFVRKPKDGLHQALALAALGMAGWNLSVFLVINEIINLHFGVANSFAWASWMAVGFTWFIYQFPNRIRHYHRFSFATMFLGLFLFLIPFIPGFITSVEVQEGYANILFNDSLYSLWSLLYIGNFLYTAVLIVVRAFRASGVDRQRLMQVLLGFLMFFIPSMASNLLLPLLLNDFRWNNLGPVFTIFLIFFLLNAVLRYRLLNIKWILGRSFFFSAIIGIVLWIFASVVFLVSDVFDTQIGFVLSALVIALFFKPIWDFLEKIFSKLINFGAYRPEVATEELFNIVRTEGDLDKLVEKLLERFTSYFAQEESALVIFEPKSTKIAKADCIGYKKICSQRSASQLARIAEDMGLKIIEKNEIIWNQKFGKDEVLKKREAKLLPIIESAGVETLIPLVIDHQLVGLIIFGTNHYEKALRASDLTFLELVRSGISPALENAAKLEQTRRLLERLSELDKAKSEFINIVSHRFRTPLSAIRWNLETVLDVHGKKIGKDVSEALMDSQDRTLFLIETLDRLFDSLAIESGKLKLNPKKFSTKEAFTSSIDDYKKRCKEKGIICKSEVESFKAWGDEHRLAGIVKSLLSNSVQYTPAGGKVSLRISKVKDSLEIQVTDTGIGIPPAAQEKIFEKFYRAKNAVLTYADGQGLGMFYIKQITVMHGGKVDVESKLNEGTTMTVKIPIKK